MKEQGHLLTCDGCGQERFIKVISCISSEVNECSGNTVWKYDYAGFGWIHIFDGSALGKDYCPDCAKEYYKTIDALLKEAYGEER